MEEDEVGVEVNRSNNSTNLDDSFTCKFCDDNFKTKRELMKHKKKDHKENIAQCWKYSAGNSEFGDENCWLDHCSTESKKFKCGLREQVFSVQSDFHSHRKEKHRQLLPLCKNFHNGTCVYGKELCWFKHELIEKRIKVKSFDNLEDVIQKLLQIMEIFQKEW